MRAKLHGCHLYLKSLKLAGFKSFADRTRLEFEPGVSVVVGPNGTGKSNVVDAVAWVLGSQFTRALRTDRMEDVIFAGTATRQSHSRAEVTLVLDNADRLLPIDLDEVSLTRRLFRGGLSEYEINGVQCRLLDVQEMLSDSGVGRHQHLIVGQGRLDSLLSTKGEHRRRIIEEAAGILKHQIRKAKALSRLEDTDGDVRRLHDIVAEIKRRKRPLRRQAEAAERHRQVSTELRSLRLWLGAESLRASRHRRQELVEERARLVSTLDLQRSDLMKIEESLARLELGRARLSRAVDVETAAAARLDTVAARLRGISEVARERAGGVMARMEATEQRRRTVEVEGLRLAERLAEATEQEEKARHELVAKQAAFEALADRLRVVPDPEPIPVEARMAALRTELSALQGVSGRDATEREHLASLIEAARKWMVDDRETLADLAAQLQRIAERLEAARRETATLASGRQELEAVWERAVRLLRSAEGERIAARARAQAVEDLAFPSSDAARKRVEAAGEVLGTLSGCLDVPEDLATAVEAALGAWAEGLVIRNAEQMVRVISALKSDGAGGPPLVHPDHVVEDPVCRSVAQARGVHALVDMLGSRADRKLGYQLLGAVVVVESWDTGLDIVREDPHITAVTPEGDLITYFGVRTSDPARISPRMVEAIQRQGETTELTVAEAARAESQAANLLEESRRAESGAHSELEALESDHARVVTEMDGIHKARMAAEHEIARLSGRLDSVRTGGLEREQRLLRVQKQIGSLQGALQERRESRERLLSRRSEVKADHSAAGVARDDAMRELGAAVERRRNLESRLSRVREELEQLGSVPAVEPELERARSVSELALRVIEVVGVKLQELGDRSEDSKRQVSAFDGRVSSGRQERSRLEQVIDEARSGLGELAVEEAELRVREESAVEGLRRDADASVEQALATERPITAGEDPAGQAASLAAGLARLGPVNVLAAEEFRELDERHRLISEQLADLKGSRAELTKIVATLDREMEEMFSRTFEEAARHYRHYFAALFPGGSGRMVLTDPDNPLEGGVEIEAQPLGKKVGKIALLSGGERSLAALAFLFAVFKASPGPFYILDEVDAALDDANLHRFLRLVDEFREHAQLVVVTHQQATMRAADVLYGVTMEPGGSSQALVRRMAEVPALV